MSEGAVGNSIRTVEQTLEASSDSVAERHQLDEGDGVQEKAASPIPEDSVET